MPEYTISQIQEQIEHYKAVIKRQQAVLNLPHTLSPHRVMQQESASRILPQAKAELAHWQQLLDQATSDPNNQ